MFFEKNNNILFSLFRDDIGMKSKMARYSSNFTPSPCFQCVFKLLLHKYFIWKKQHKNELVTFVTSCTTHIGKICKLSNVVFSIRNTLCNKILHLYSLKRTFNVYPLFSNSLGQTSEDRTFTISYVLLLRHMLLYYYYFWWFENE